MFAQKIFEPSSGLKVDDVVLSWQEEVTVSMLYDRFEDIMRNDLEIKISIIRAGMQKITNKEHGKSTRRKLKMEPGRTNSAKMASRMGQGKEGTAGRWTGKTSCRRKKREGLEKMRRGRRRMNSWSLEDWMMKKPR